MTEPLTSSSSLPVRASGEPQKHTIRVISHGPTLIERAQQWQREHAEANTPSPDDTYLLIRDFLIAASPEIESLKADLYVSRKHAADLQTELTLLEQKVQPPVSVPSSPAGR